MSHSDVLEYSNVIYHNNNNNIYTNNNNNNVWQDATWDTVTSISILGNKRILSLALHHVPTFKTPFLARNLDFSEQITSGRNTLHITSNLE